MYLLKIVIIMIIESQVNTFNNIKRTTIFEYSGSTPTWFYILHNGTKILEYKILHTLLQINYSQNFRKKDCSTAKYSSFSNQPPWQVITLLLAAPSKILEHHLVLHPTSFLPTLPSSVMINPPSTMIFTNLTSSLMMSPLCPT